MGSMAYGTNLRFTLGLDVGACSSAVGALSSAVGALSLVGAWSLVGALVSSPAAAGPVVCTTTLEAPNSSGQALNGGAAGPVEVTRCGVVQTTPQLMEQRFFSYTAPFARGVSLTNQITDLFGIAMGGGDGTRVMGFGFPIKRSSGMARQWKIPIKCYFSSRVIPCPGVRGMCQTAIPAAWDPLAPSLMAQAGRMAVPATALRCAASGSTAGEGV